MSDRELPEDLDDERADDAPEDEDQGGTMTLDELDIEAPEDDVAEQRQVVRQEDDEYR